MRIFRNPNWQVVALFNEPFFSGLQTLPPGEPEMCRGLFERDHLAPLLSILQERQTPHIYLTYMGGPDQLETLLIPPRRPELNAAWLSNDLFMMLCCFATDDRADWGLVIDENVMYLGGEQDLMKRFAAESGGMDELIRLFSLYIEEHTVPGAPHYGVAPARFYRHLYSYCGWDWPFPEPPL